MGREPFWVHSPLRAGLIWGFPPSGSESGIVDYTSSDFLCTHSLFVVCVSVCIISRWAIPVCPLLGARLLWRPPSIWERSGISGLPLVWSFTAVWCVLYSTCRSYIKSCIYLLSICQQIGNSAHVWWHRVSILFVLGFTCGGALVRIFPSQWMGISIFGARDLWSWETVLHCICVFDIW